MTTRSTRTSPGQRGNRPFDGLLSQADVFYGIPDTKPSALGPAVRANPKLRWEHTMAAGGGAQVRDAGLTNAELGRVVFTTSAGVHGPTLAEFAMFGVLAGAKDLARPQAQQARRQWTGRWAMKQVHEQTVLVAGLGGIGKQTARLAKAFGAYVIGTKRRPTPVENVDEVHPTGRLADLSSRAGEPRRTDWSCPDVRRLAGNPRRARTTPLHIGPRWPPWLV